MGRGVSHILERLSAGTEGPAAETSSRKACGHASAGHPDVSLLDAKMLSAAAPSSDEVFSRWQGRRGPGTRPGSARGS